MSNLEHKEEKALEKIVAAVNTLNKELKEINALLP